MACVMPHPEALAMALTGLEVPGLPSAFFPPSLAGCFQLKELGVDKGKQLALRSVAQKPSAPHPQMCRSQSSLLLGDFSELLTFESSSLFSASGKKEEGTCS